MHIFGIHSGLFAQVIGPGAVHPEAGRAQMKESIGLIRFALRRKHSSRRPGRRFSGGGPVQNEDRSAVDGEFAGNGKPDDAAANDYDIVHFMILHEDSAQVAFVVL
jgi:hypothetical protein